MFQKYDKVKLKKDTRDHWKGMEFIFIAESMNGKIAYVQSANYIGMFSRYETVPMETLTHVTN